MNAKALKSNQLGEDHIAGKQRVGICSRTDEIMEIGVITMLFQVTACQALWYISGTHYVIFHILIRAIYGFTDPKAFFCMESQPFKKPPGSLLYLVFLHRGGGGVSHLVGEWWANTTSCPSQRVRKRFCVSRKYSFIRSLPW